MVICADKAPYFGIWLEPPVYTIPHNINMDMHRIQVIPTKNIKERIVFAACGALTPCFAAKQLDLLVEFGRNFYLLLFYRNRCLISDV